MSRIGKLPIPIPEGVEIGFMEDRIDVKGPKGQVSVARYPLIEYVQDNGHISLHIQSESKEVRSQYGLRRTLLNNAVQGVSKGFEKGLELVGVGYRVQVQEDAVELNVGYSHPKIIQLPPGISARTEGNKVFVAGINKELVGEVAARIRRVRPPEPYKGKGIQYIDEQIRRKAGKSAKK